MKTKNDNWVFGSFLIFQLLVIVAGMIFLAWQWHTLRLDFSHFAKKIVSQQQAFNVGLKGENKTVDHLTYSPDARDTMTREQYEILNNAQ